MESLPKRDLMMPTTPESKARTPFSDSASPISSRKSSFSMTVNRSLSDEFNNLNQPSQQPAKRPKTTIVSDKGAATSPNSKACAQQERMAVGLSDCVYQFDEGVMSETVARTHRQNAIDNYLRVERGRRASRAKRRRRELGATSSEEEDETDGAVSTQCPHCNKVYRQNNSLFKHLYEHHSEWGAVSKSLNTSKHQQVQMMQTAELLLSLRAPITHGLQPLVRF